jgi:predicted tellurium resistance membrane protein TerC
MFEIFTAPQAWIALFTLILLEIFVSIDNIVFISFASEKLEKGQRKKTIYSGLALAIILRVVLLIAITLLLSFKKPFLMLDTDWISGSLSTQSALLFAGGLFLLYKGTKELREKVEDRRHDEREVKRESGATFSKALVQVLVINMVFSLDSVIAAVGLTNSITADDYDALVIMLLAALISLLIMISIANTINALVEKHPSIKIIGLAFMMLIGFVLLADAAHASHLTLFGNEAIFIPKGYLYFTILFCVVVFLIEFARNTKNNTK